MGIKVQLLFSALSTEAAAVGEEGRQLAAVMLRRLITSEFEEFFPKVRYRHVSDMVRFGGSKGKNVSLFFCYFIFLSFPWSSRPSLSPTSW